MGVFNKTIIPLALVGYEMIIANWALLGATRRYSALLGATRRYAPRWLFTMSYPTRPSGIIVNFYIVRVLAQSKSH